MNTETLDKMRYLRLFGMCEAFKTSLESTIKETLTPDQFIHMLVTSEWDNRRQRAVERAIKQACFRYKASLEDLDYTIERGLDKNHVHRLASLDFIKEHKDLFITGSTGTGKSYLCSALGYHACQNGYKVLYANTAKLMGQLKMAKAKGTIITEMKRIERMDLLILDDFGLQPFDTQARASLLDIVEDRHNRRSTIITSQIPVKEWYDAIGDKTVADAVLDRIVHHSLRVELFGESLIVMEGMRAELSVAELCRKYGISQPTYYKWNKEFIEAGKKRLSGDEQREATCDEVKELKKENSMLKESLADLVIRYDIVKKSLDLLD